MGRWVTYKENYPFFELLNIEARPGVYVVYLDDILAYIGQSSNVRKRIQSYSIHYRYSSLIQTPWGQVDSLHIKVSYSLRYGDWAMRELRLIKRLQPQENCVHSIRKRASG